MVRDQRISQPVGALRFDAGSLALNLIATVGRRYGAPIERLDTAARLDEWLTGVGLSRAGSPSDEDLTAIRELREHLEVLFRHVVAATRPPRSVVEYVNAAAAIAQPALHSTSTGLALARSPTGDLDPIRALLAQDAIRILGSGERFHLRVCDADDCRMLYLSHGRRDRRWCSSERCGNRSRVAAHRARLARRRSVRR